ncbi:MAG: S8 family serine peptidase [Anaerolineae bacterium]|nr:S8 family serine peptidase [Anaerolineae bacterium]MDW8071935.1 S8 family serine peptidase [Anaerolineae bacterium]
MRVVVVLRPPLQDGDITAQAEVVARAQDTVLASVSNADFQLLHRYHVVPGLAGTVTPQGWQALLGHPLVHAVAFDLPVYAALGESVGVIRADRVWSELRLTGAGVNVAVLDSGYDPNHPDINDSIVAQHCFNHGTCPPANTNESDRAYDENGHGTHVTGIITGRGAVAPRGIAPDTGIVAVRVLNSAGSGWTSDVVAGIDWVVANQARLNVRIMNLSLGGGAYSGTCDTADANSMLYASAIQAAQRAGIIVFAAAGNGAMADKMMTPACISGVVAIGSTYDANLGAYTWGGANPICTDASATVDQIACTSNSSSALDLLAPGAVITSAGLGGGVSSRSGTSMATPHASAVAALLLQAQPGLSAGQIENILKETGVPITDRRNGRVTPRVDAYAAVQRVMGGTGPGASISGTVLLQSRNVHSGTAIYISDQPCTSSMSGNQIATTNAYGHFQLQPGQTGQCLWAARPGFLGAQKAAPSGSLGTITLLAGDVNRDNLINIFDIAAVAGNYGKSDPLIDFNGDLMVNLFDLVIAAVNYGKSGPLTDWR